ncbi:MAG: hypothetical protein ACOX1U_01095 [Saccharofermentanales bacterium]|jgi:hypothetical protein
MSWDKLVEQVGLLWIILVLLAAGVLLLLLVFFLGNTGVAIRRALRRLSGLNTLFLEMVGCRMENLEPSLSIVQETMNPEFALRYQRLAEDSRAMFESLWVPSPRDHLTLPEILPAATRLAMDRSSGLGLLLGGLAATTVALATAFIRLGTTGMQAEGALLRFIALLPLVVGALGLLLLHRAGKSFNRRIRHAWELLMITIGRKLPVYSHSAETARLIFEMRSYDAHMAKSVAAVAEYVEGLSSGQLTNAVSGAVKYVMAATVSPAIVKSTEALGILVDELAKQMQQTDGRIARLYSELELRQANQGELWINRYQEISNVLAYQQERLTQDLSANQQKMLTELEQAQKFALEKIVEEQTRTLSEANEVGRQSWQLLQEKLTAIIGQLQESQQKLIGDLTDQQQQTLKVIADSNHENTTELRSQYTSLIDELRRTQTELWEQSTTVQNTLYEKLQTGQDAAFSALSAQQRESYEQVARAQQEGLQVMQEQQLEAIRRLADSQAVVLEEIDRRQEAGFSQAENRQAAALDRMIETQSTAIADLRKAQLDALTESARRQQEALEQVTEDFGSEVSAKIAAYLDPISSRLQDATETLTKAQDYVANVQEVLKVQNEAAMALQESIGDLFKQLMETRKTMSEDLDSLKTSSGVMSRAAESMGSVYEGSQAGLSEAISRMSDDLMRLSDVLSAVMSGSAEQTRQMQTQSLEIYEANQKHLEAVRDQITLLSDELSTRIDQLMLGFTNLTEDLVGNVHESIDKQNDTLGGSLRNLTEVMSEEARSMSLFAQQINMDIESLNSVLRSAIEEFDSGIRRQLSEVLGQFDHEISDVVKRLARSSAELGDAVEALPDAIRQVSREDAP